MVDYTLKKMSKADWRDVKILAAKKEKTIKCLIIDLLREAVKEEG